MLRISFRFLILSFLSDSLWDQESTACFIIKSICQWDLDRNCFIVIAKASTLMIFCNLEWLPKQIWHLTWRLGLSVPNIWSPIHIDKHTKSSIFLYKYTCAKHHNLLHFFSFNFRWFPLQLLRNKEWISKAKNRNLA